MIPEQLETAHLLLRPFAADDARAVLDYWQSDPGWERFNASVPRDFSGADAQRFVEEMRARSRADRPHWAIVHDGAVVGVVSLTFEQDHRIAVIGYGVHGGLKGRGFSTEAARKVIGAAFAACPQLQRIRAHTDAENVASIRVLDKLGFTREGVLRRNQFVKGELRDGAVFGLLRDEWVP